MGRRCGVWAAGHMELSTPAHRQLATRSSTPSVPQGQRSHCTHPRTRPPGPAAAGCGGAGGRGSAARSAGQRGSRGGVADQQQRHLNPGQEGPERRPAPLQPPTSPPPRHAARPRTPAKLSWWATMDALTVARSRPRCAHMAACARCSSCLRAAARGGRAHSGRSARHGQRVRNAVGIPCSRKRGAPRCRRRMRQPRLASTAAACTPRLLRWP